MRCIIVFHVLCYSNESVFTVYNVHSYLAILGEAYNHLICQQSSWHVAIKLVYKSGTITMYIHCHAPCTHHVSEAVSSDGSNAGADPEEVRWVRTNYPSS